MEQRAVRLAEYAEERLGDGLRAVGYHTGSDYGLLFARQDVRKRYSRENIEDFIDTSRALHHDMAYLGEQLGRPEASLHLLGEGLIVQFHFHGDDVVFLSMDREVGRNFTRFIRECIDRMG